MSPAEIAPGDRRWVPEASPWRKRLGSATPVGGKAVQFYTEFKPAAVILTYACGGLSPVCPKGGRQKRPRNTAPMNKTPLPREDAHSEMLLVVAQYWRRCAAQSSESWRSDMMRGTAEEFERAAAKATSQTLAHR